MLSKYGESLSGDARTRYLSKIECINVDPYSLSTVNPSLLPAVESTDLVNYLVLGTSSYTAEQFKAYRSLEAYNQCLNGWIQEIAGCVINDLSVVVAKVRTCLSTVLSVILVTKYLTVQAILG